MTTITMQDDVARSRFCWRNLQQPCHGSSCMAWATDAPPLDKLDTDLPDYLVAKLNEIMAPTNVEGADDAAIERARLSAKTFLMPWAEGVFNKANADAAERGPWMPGYNGRKTLEEEVDSIIDVFFNEGGEVTGTSFDLARIDNSWKPTGHCALFGRDRWSF